ncbi:MAG: hypothetical protein K2N23_03435, partial [Clostridia bacterium]|nr:hypothetical protein [Clostridia bacterium]
MKKILKGVLAISCAALGAFGLSACGNAEPKSTVLGSPQDTTTIEYTERDTVKVKTISESAEKFAADFASLAYKNYKDDTNFTVAPVSVYMALSLAAQCAGGDTQSEILSALGVSYDQLLNGFSDYYRSLFAEYTYEGKIKGMIDFSNSIWLDNSAAVKQNCVDTLAEKFHCYSYKADFMSDNKSANEAVRQFVKDKTKGLIDRDFKLSTDTLFALINTLYLKDIWNAFGDELLLTNKVYDFSNYDSSVKKTKLLRGYYNSGRVYEGKNYNTFFTSTNNGNKIKFILPKNGNSVDDIFTAENLAEINSITDYNAVDDVNKIKYYTRCLFPEFTAEYDEDIRGLLKEMGISSMFSFATCDFSELVSVPTCCTKVVHATKLKVDKTGMEGAAVTVIGVDASAPPPVIEYEEV